MSFEEAFNIPIGSKILCVLPFGRNLTKNKVYEIVEKDCSRKAIANLRVIGDDGDYWWIDHNFFNLYFTDKSINDAIDLINKKVSEVKCI